MTGQPVHVHLTGSDKLHLQITTLLQVLSVEKSTQIDYHCHNVMKQIVILLVNFSVSNLLRHFAYTYKLYTKIRNLRKSPKENVLSNGSLYKIKKSRQLKDNFPAYGTHMYYV